MSKNTPTDTQTAKHAHDEHTHDHNHDHADHDHAGHSHDHTHDHAGHSHAPAATKPADSAIIENSKVTVTIPWEKAKVAYDKALAKIAQHVKMDGFRPGKVPANVASTMIKPEAVFEEALQEVFPPAYAEEIKKSKKLPISRPEIEPVSMEKGKDWVFTVYFAEQQPVELGKYMDVVKKALKEAEVEIAKMGEEKKPDAKAEDKTAEPKPALTDNQKEDVKIKKIFQGLIESVKPKVQEILIRSEVNREIQKLVDQLQQLGLKVEDYLRSRQMTGEQLQQEYAVQALTTLQVEFILAEIAKDQKLTINDKEIDDTLDQVGGGKISAEQRKNADYRSYLFSMLLKQKVMKSLLKAA